LNTDWTEIEVIDLISDSSGLGFGIIGSKSTGVVVRTILSGGAADTDGRLRSGDHLLCIGLVSVRGMNSEQVASVLRQSGDRVRLVVARVIHDPAAESTVGVDGRCCQLVPTGELEAHLEALVAALDACAAASAEEEQEEQQAEAPSVDDSAGAAAAAAAATAPAVADVGAVDAGQESSVASSRRESASHHGSNHRVCDGSDSSAQNLLTEAVQLHQTLPASCFENPEASPSNGQAEAEEEQADSKEQEMSRLSPDEEVLWVDLEKGSQGLGITIAGYVGETLREQSERHFCEECRRGERSGPRRATQTPTPRVSYAQVDNQSLDGRSNHEAVELLKRTGSTVRLKVLRYRRGPVFDQLQAGTANTPPPLHRSVSVTAATRGGQAQAKRHQQPLRQAHSLQATSGDGSCCDENDAEFKDRRVTNSTAVSVEAPTDKPLTDEEVEAARARWCSLLAEQEPDCEVVVARLTKFKDCPGLGVSLEGTVELLADGRTLLPRHCIRALLPDGPAGREGSLRLGDELLEVNGHRLHGLNHLEVVDILKSLPQHVCVICSRKRPTQPKQNPTGQLKKQTGMAAVSANNSVPGAKSRSFDNFSGMGVWSDSPTVVELEKTTRGLGFSVLDYQDPLCPEDSAAVIIVRSLVPNGAAHRDGRILPGDRLLFVNDVSLERASLEEAVRCLKAAPLGRIVLGVAKPCPLLALAAAGSGTASGGGGAVGSKAAVRGVRKAGVSPTVASAAARKSLCHVSTSQLADITDGNWRPATAASTPSPPSSSSSSSTFDPQRADNRVSDDPEQLDSRLRLHSIEEDAGAPATTPTASAPAASESSFPVTPPPDESTTKSDDTQARVDTIQDESIDGQSSAASATPDSEQLNEFSSELVRRALDNVLAQCAEERLVCHRLVSEVLDEAQRRINAELQQQLEIVVNNVNGSVESSLSSSGSEQSLISSSSSGDMLGDLERLRDCGSDTDALFNHLEQTTDADEPAEYDDFGDQNSAISFQHRWLDDTPPPAPESLERSVRLSKTTDFEDLGLALESVDKGVNGCVVRDLTPGGPADRCGQIRLGDFVTSINSECTRRVPTAQARAILRRAALVNQDTTARQQDPSILAPNKSFKSAALARQDGSPAIRSLNSWGSPRLVRVRRDDRRNLGISIVGGKVAGHGLQQSVCGIFIKHVSEAGADRREGVLRTGDRILEVG
uniref:Patj homolog n=1 Tax=Macrostomum lignano TaxID=282301 RepID=A0A1I8IKU8_9PLAT